jgi:3-hydroxybutyryl-CoA dehydrogenase
MSEILEDYSLSQKLQRKGSLQKVGIIGCGSVGQELVRLVSQHGIEVHFIEISEEKVQDSLAKINRQLDEMINRWGLTESEKRAILARIKGSVNYNDISKCDIVIESINVNTSGTSIECRKAIFKKIEAAVKPETVIASNTSTLMISDLASILERPERAIGMHFMTPESTVKIVEVVRGIRTSDATFEFTCKVASMLEKKVIPINDSPGNISTRLITTLINEACEVLMEGVASVKEIDETMKLGYGLQFGPLELADKIGLDKVLKYMDNLYTEFGHQKFKASPIIKRLVRGGNLGRKVGKGFYKYEDGKIVGQTIQCTEYRY